VSETVGVIFLGASPLEPAFVVCLIRTAGRIGGSIAEMGLPVVRRARRSRAVACSFWGLCVLETRRKPGEWETSGSGTKRLNTTKLYCSLELYLPRF
jgi:hypothetical protein